MDQETGGRSPGKRGSIEFVEVWTNSQCGRAEQTPADGSTERIVSAESPVLMATLYTVDLGAGCRLNCGGLEGVPLRRSCEARDAGPLSVVA